MNPTRSIRGQTVLLATALIALGVTGVLVAGATQLTVRAANDQATHERAIQAQLDELEIGMVNQETGLRGYALTGRTDFLEPYDKGRQQVIAAERTLDRFEVGDRSRASYESMKSAATLWQAWAEKLTAVIEGGGAGNLAVEQTLEDKRLFEAFRNAADRFSHATEMEAVTAQAAADQQATRLLILVPALAATGFAILLLLLSVFFRSTLGPIRQLIEVASALARSEQVVIPRLDRHDEVGRLARALAAWERSSYKRMALAESMLQVTGEVELATVLELGIARLREVLGAAEVIVLARTASGLELAAAKPYEFDSTWTAEGVHDAEAWQVKEPTPIDLRGAEHGQAVRTWTHYHGLGPALVVPMISGGRPLGVVVAVRKRDQRAFDASDQQLAQVIVPALGAAIHVSYLFMDLTAANAELERASRVKSQFLANMSHELRTPLNSVLGFAQLLASSDFGPLTDRQQRYVRHIASSGHQLLELINDVLDLAKIEAGKLEMVPERTWLELLVEECVVKMRPAAAAKRIAMQIEVSPEQRVWADPRRLRQVILNLLSNAIKFTPEKGTVSMRAGTDGGWVWLSISDSGIGIAVENLSLIFDEFTQIDSTLSRESTGSGLGLPLSRRLVDLMGGTITVESKAGAGSTFIVRLPTAALLEDAAGY